MRSWPTRCTRSPLAPAACRSAWATRQYFLVRVRPEDISDENLRRIFIGVMDDLSYAQSQGGDKGNIRATKRLTDDEDARSIARRILELYHGLDGLLKMSDPSLNVVTSKRSPT